MKIDEESNEEFEEELNILQFNDIYDINPINGVGGLAKLKSIMDLERKGKKNVIALLCGDFLAPSILSCILINY
jgi:2',3'-cyclic-nucleotide 2'-phosphodiesterase (5'-nucleotidase family)